MVNCVKRYLTLLALLACLIVLPGCPDDDGYTPSPKGPEVGEDPPAPADEAADDEGETMIILPGVMTDEMLDDMVLDAGGGPDPDLE